MQVQLVAVAAAWWAVASQGAVVLPEGDSMEVDAGLAAGTTPYACGEGGGSIITAYTDTDGSVMLRRYSPPTFAPLGPPVQAATGTAVGVACVGNGGFAVLWIDSLGLHTRWYRQRGSPLGAGPMLVSTETQISHLAVTGTNSGFAACWGQQDDGVRCTFLSPLTSPSVFLADPNGSRPSVVPAPDEDVLVSWSTQTAVVVQRFDEDGNRVGEAREYAAAGGPTALAAASVVYLRSGNEVVVSTGSATHVVATASPARLSATSLPSGSVVVGWGEGAAVLLPSGEVVPLPVSTAAGRVVSVQTRSDMFVTLSGTAAQRYRVWHTDAVVAGRRGAAPPAFPLYGVPPPLAATSPAVWTEADVDAGAVVQLTCGAPVCDFFLFIFHCPPCSTRVNGGYPSSLPPTGFLPTSCAPTFKEGGLGRMVGFRKSLTAGEFVELPATDRPLARLAIFAAEQEVQGWCPKAEFVGPSQPVGPGCLCL